MKNRSTDHWWAGQSCWRSLWRGWADQTQMSGCPTLSGGIYREMKIYQRESVQNMRLNHEGHARSHYIRPSLLQWCHRKERQEKTSLRNVSPHQIHEHNGGQGDVGSWKNEILQVDTRLNNRFSKIYLWNILLKVKSSNKKRENNKKSNYAKAQSKIVKKENLPTKKPNARAHTTKLQ